MSPPLVDLWWLPVPAGKGYDGRLLERAAARRAAHGALAAGLGVGADTLKISHATGGRPVVSSPACGAQISTSRAPGRAVAALCARGPIGVDVECLDRDLDAELVARQFFPPAEYAELAVLPPAEFRAQFFASWTWKEAVLKAAGTGLRQPLPARGGPASLLRADHAVTVWPEPAYVLTVVTAAPRPRLRWRGIPPAPTRGVALP